MQTLNEVEIFLKKKRKSIITNYCKKRWKAKRREEIKKDVSWIIKTM